MDEQFASSAKPVRETADDILREIDSVMEPVLDRINAWLASLEGKTFEAATGVEEIAAIRHVVRRAGAQLLFNGQRVTVNGLKQPGQRLHVKVAVVAQGAGTRKSLHANIYFPRLTAEPLSKKS